MTHCTQKAFTDGTCCASQPCRNTRNIELATVPLFTPSNRLAAAIIAFGVVMGLIGYATIQAVNVEKQMAQEARI